MSALYEWANNNNSHIVEGGEDGDGEVWRLETGGVGVNIFLPLDVGCRECRGAISGCPWREMNINLNTVGGQRHENGTRIFYEKLYILQ